MSEVQIGNARTVVFIAMAVVVFWIVVWRGYWMSCDLWHDSGSYHGGIDRVGEEFAVESWLSLPLMGMSLGLVPVVFFYAARAERLTGRPGRSEWTTGLCFVCACGYCCWMGGHDAEIAYSLVSDERTSTFRGFMARHAEARATHVVSWSSLLLPILLTTAFVIYGGWRSAVKRASMAVVDEEEVDD